jgi:hypothetical protein
MRQASALADACRFFWQNSTPQRRGTIIRWIPGEGGRAEQQGTTGFMAGGFGGTTGIGQQGAKKMPGPAKGCKGK